MSKRNSVASEPMTPKEKKVFTIIFIAAGLLILLVILLNINWNGDRDKFLKEFPIEDKTHVFRYISLSELDETLTSKDGKKFHVFIGNPSTPLNFVTLANKYAKQAGVDEIYYLNISRFTDEEKTHLSRLLGEQYSDVFGTGAKLIPSLVCFENGENQRMSAYNSSDNYTNIIKEYFTECGYSISE